MGEDVKAFELLGEAVRGAPQNAEIQFHFAAVAAVPGRASQARGALARALSLDPKLESREDLRSLRAHLGVR